jgi:hypothetical protein
MLLFSFTSGSKGLAKAMHNAVQARMKSIVGTQPMIGVPRSDL